MEKPDTFGAIFPTPAYKIPGVNYATRSLSDITDFIIHHSAGGVDQTPADIDNEHRARGMAFIAYNWIITKDGTVYQGRPLGWVSSAAYGRNKQSVNVVLTGNFEHGDSGYTGKPTAKQIESLNRLALTAHTHITSIERTIGHRDVSSLFYSDSPANYSTACPGSDLYALIPSVREYVRSNLHHGL